MALLLLHATMSLAWLQYTAMGSDLPTAPHSELTAEQHPCHDSGETVSVNGEKGCVFCGYAVQFTGSRIGHLVLLEMDMPAPLVATAPRPEHPVETPPPKIQLLA
ncbi:MAG: hypothetical protein ABW098_09860 [Candidatus Thiodiazotropha sp.]